MTELVLELDVGNTALKWRSRRGAEVLGSGRLDFEALPELAGLSADVASIAIASVASDQRNEQLSAFFSGLGVRCQFARTQSRCGPLRNAYSDVSLMGVDRWLAMVAAFAEVQKACLVVDIGTATTLDLIDGGGQHLGGYIIPGPQMQVDALSAGTDRVRFGEELQPSVAPGRSTAECVYHGKWLVVMSVIERAGRQLFEISGGAPRIVVSGGAAPAIIQLAGDEAASWLYREHLVLDGLRPVLAAEAGQNN